MTTTQSPSDLDEKKVRQREAARKYRERNRERVRAMGRKAAKIRRKKHPERHKSWKLKSVYGITLAQRDLLLAKQGGVCAICKSATSGRRDWHVDHCHRTNTVRGVLCHHCNLLLGNARDDTGRLAAAITYLQNPPARAVLH